VSDSGGWNANSGPAAVDRNTDTAAVHVASGNHWLQYDFGAPKLVTRARINEDNSNWEVDSWQVQYSSPTAWRDSMALTPANADRWHENNFTDYDAENETIRETNDTTIELREFEPYGTAPICDANGGQCDVCNAGTGRCVQNALYECSDDGQGYERIAQCGVGLCDPNADACLACATAGAHRCAGATLYECAPNRMSETSQNCGDPDLCDADEGICLTCETPGAARCEGADLITCDADQQGETVEDCGDPDLCDAAAGACLVCDAPGAVRCDGATLYICAADQLSETSEDCGSADRCSVPASMCLPIMPADAGAGN
jgi:hypothetical protein